MDVLEQLDTRITALLHKLKALEEENGHLRKELEDIRQNRDLVLERVDNLLRRVQGEIE